MQALGSLDMREKTNPQQRFFCRQVSCSVLRDQRTGIDRARLKGYSSFSQRATKAECLQLDGRDWMTQHGVRHVTEVNLRWKTRWAVIHTCSLKSVVCFKNSLLY